MDSIIDKGKRLLPAMFSGGMRRIRLATSNGELWGTLARSAKRLPATKSRALTSWTTSSKEAC